MTDHHCNHFRPTRSSVLYQQMIGRGLRLFEGKDSCLCIDLVDTAARNSIITTPSLMGLDSDFDAKGRCCVISELAYVVSFVMSR